MSIHSLLHYEFISHLCFAAFIKSSVFFPHSLPRHAELCFRIHSHSRAPNTTSTKIWIIAGCDTIDFYRVHWRRRRRPELRFDIDEFERRARFKSYFLACYRFISWIMNRHLSSYSGFFQVSFIDFQPNFGFAALKSVSTQTFIFDTQ